MVSHCDEETLSLIALGESGDAVDEAHLNRCARCQSRIDQLRAVVASSRSLTDEDWPVEPPAAVWEAIVAELGQQDAVVTAIDSARRRRRAWVLTAAAAVLGVALGAVVTASLLRTPEESLVAQTALSPLGDGPTGGTAVVERDGDTSVLVVSVPDLPAVADGYYEVWMATADTSKMVSMGALNPGDPGRFTLPAGMDVTAYPIVDVSVEHFDGNPAHSATSVVRGQLPA